jgi:hypothetical protein
MAIYRLLQNLPLGPEELERLARAYEAALEALHLTDREDPMTELVAKKVIEVGQLGWRDPAKICEIVVRELAPQGAPGKNAAGKAG